MSLGYVPDQAAIVGSPANVTLLSQRDVALEIPINFVTAPSVSVTAACFSDRQYVASATAKCISNILAVGFQRLVVDLYWDPVHMYWSLCPVELPVSSSQTSVTTTLAQTSSPPSISTNAVQSLERRILNENPSQKTSNSPGKMPSGFEEYIAVRKREGVPDNALSNHAAAISLVGEQIFDAGSYKCGAFANITLVLGVLDGYLHATDTTLEASFKQIIFNLHVASPNTNPSSPAAKLSRAGLPAGSNLLGNILSANLSSYLYVPTALNEQRADLNSSWSAAPPTDVPSADYFTNVTRRGVPSTSPDGWPSEGFLEFYRQSRLLFGFGTVDSQLDDYDMQNDTGTLFPPGFLSRPSDASFTSNGGFEGNCIFNPAATSLSSVNSSWAQSDIEPGMQLSTSATLNAAQTLTDCGISPYLVSPLANSTADRDVAAYRNFTLAAVWSWAPRQPMDDASAKNNGVLGSHDDDEFRCAYLNSTDAPTVNYIQGTNTLSAGRWTVTSCRSRLPAACRNNMNPYVWSVSRDTGFYFDLSSSCPEDSSFAVPRTALENQYLLSTARSHFDNAMRSDEKSDIQGMVYINLNSLDQEACWVSGVNSTCPYSSTANQNDGQVVVPTVAALAIIVLAVLTILAKCGANRRRSRKRRRVRDGWEYEGVPS